MESISENKNPCLIKESLFVVLRLCFFLLFSHARLFFGRKKKAQKVNININTSALEVMLVEAVVALEVAFQNGS
jgi:hypothetical protein